MYFCAPNTHAHILWMLLYRKNTPSKQLNNNGRADTYEQYLEPKFIVKYLFTCQVRRNGHRAAEKATTLV